MTNWKKILVAVDGTETSKRALGYVAEISQAMTGVEICLLHLYPEPPPNLCRDDTCMAAHRAEKEANAQKIFAEAMALFEGCGLSREQISCVSRLTVGETISKVILQEQAQGGFGTVVVGKRGVTKAEEFLFGSISNTVVRSCNNFTVWVVG